MCMGKCSPSQRDGIVVGNIILYNYVYDLFYFLFLFYFIYSYDVILTLML